MRVDLFEFEEKTIVPILRFYHNQFRVRDPSCDLALFREHEQPVCLYSDDKCTLWELLEHIIQRATPTCQVMSVEFASDVNVTVCVESRNELVSLVA